jgi:hypothetical protein
VAQQPALIARNCAEELADAYDLNRGITRAILWASFAIRVFWLVIFLFSTRSGRRSGRDPVDRPLHRTGYGGRCILLYIESRIRSASTPKVVGARESAKIEAWN